MSVDHQELRRIHDKMALGYPFPDLTSPLFAVLEEVRDESGALRGACAVKIIGEAFLWVDPDLSETEKGRAVVELAQKAPRLAIARGFNEVSAWIPPGIEASFGPLLEKRGWIRSPWQSYSRILR